MQYVIPARRAGVDALVKAVFSRGPRPGVKYIKKVPYFSGGKMKWRYYYRDEHSRKHGRGHHDPYNDHDHHLIGELKDHHKNLVGKVRSAIETGMQFIKGLFGFKKQPDTAAGAVFTQKFIEPPIAAEKEGKSPDANAATVKMAQAIEMLPDHLKAMVDPAQIPKVKGGKYKGLKSFSLLDNMEDPYILRLGLLGMLTVGGHASRTEGHLIVNGLSFEGGKKGVTSKPDFNSPETVTEEVFWHEFGHHIHYAIEESITRGELTWKKAWEEWADGLDGKKISGYAGSHTYEDFAESFACMISHPKQLAMVCKERYEWMQQHLFERRGRRREPRLPSTRCTRRRISSTRYPSRGAPCTSAWARRRRSTRPAGIGCPRRRTPRPSRVRTASP